MEEIGTWKINVFVDEWTLVTRLLLFDTKELLIAAEISRNEAVGMSH